ncbi:hypothetical protein [Capybara microvirus Cap3_SP_646]|nr:hypothetical protein [Capybara microvirus Cap3_SP_646]
MAKKLKILDELKLSISDYRAFRNSAFTLCYELDDKENSTTGSGYLVLKHKSEKTILLRHFTNFDNYIRFLKQSVIMRLIADAKSVQKVNEVYRKITEGFEDQINISFSKGVNDEIS